MYLLQKGHVLTTSTTTTNWKTTNAAHLCYQEGKVSKKPNQKQLRHTHRHPLSLLSSGVRLHKYTLALPTVVCGVTRPIYGTLETLPANSWSTTAFSQEMDCVLLTGASSGRSGCQPAAGARGWARLHSLLEAMAWRAHSLTSHIGECLGKGEKR